MSTHLSRNGFNGTDKTGYSPPAGAIALTPDTYRRINGFSNMFWGWGGEDADFLWRMKAAVSKKSEHSNEGGEVLRLNAIDGRY